MFTVTVRPAAHAATGKYEESLSIQTDDASIGTITIPVHVWVKPNLYANPDVVDFGNISREAKVASEPEVLIGWFSRLGLAVTRIGLEAGPLSQWLYASMRQAG